MAAGYSPTPSQIIDGHFMNQKRLLETLRDIFGTTSVGEGNFRVEVRHAVGRTALCNMLTHNFQ